MDLGERMQTRQIGVLEDPQKGFAVLVVGLSVLFAIPLR